LIHKEWALHPYDAYDLVKKLKATVDIPIQLHAHATTGLSTASIVKAVEAGIDRVDTAIGSMSMTYGHSATNSVVSILEKCDIVCWATGNWLAAI
jgi:oxaloacetate decarboxylase alpha subunit